MIFVYVRGLRGPAPEKWPVMQTDMKGNRRPYLAKHALGEDEAKLPIAELVKLYPPPHVEPA